LREYREALLSRNLSSGLCAHDCARGCHLGVLRGYQIAGCNYLRSVPLGNFGRRCLLGRSLSTDGIPRGKTGLHHVVNACGCLRFGFGILAGGLLGTRNVTGGGGLRSPRRPARLPKLGGSAFSFCSRCGESVQLRGGLRNAGRIDRQYQG